MLSKYQEKIKKRYCETESGRIAYAIWEHRDEISYHGSKELSIKLDDGIEIGEEGYLALVVSKIVPYKANRYWIKIVPSFEDDIDTLINILDAQRWQYF